MWGKTRGGSIPLARIQLIYLDNNATTQPAEAVVDAVGRVLRENWGNPSSVHDQGRRARHAVEESRETVAALIGCSPREVIFTSGGTESCNAALESSLDIAAHGTSGRRVIVTTRFEHSAVREKAQALALGGAEVVWLEGGSGGIIDPATLNRLLQQRANEIAVVSIMWANNETGVIQPIRELASMCRRNGVRFHTDATQWVGRMPTDLSSIDIDLLSLSAHKFHGPKGIGVLFVRRGSIVRPLIVGGPQERDRRGGTENVAGIVGCGVAAQLAHEWLSGAARETERAATLRTHFESTVCAALPDAVVIGRTAPRIWTTSNIAFRSLQAEAILVALNAAGVAASAGAACSSGSLDPSPVLLAMGVTADLAHGAVRFSFARTTTEDHVTQGARIVVECVGRCAASMPSTRG